jgi:YesN/AraC family two-component response regulator
VNDAEQRSRASGEPIRVAVVDDAELFRRGLTMLLTAEDGIEVVGEAADGIAATELAAVTAPDVILMDIRMPKGSGIDACQLCRETRHCPRYQIRPGIRRESRA